jgi:hypothetical protein
LSEKDCRTISLEVGMQNSGFTSGFAVTMGNWRLLAWRALPFFYALTFL